MRKLITLIAVCFALSASAQSTTTVTLKAGTDGYVTINGQNYPRGYLLTEYTYRTTDSLMSILYANNRTYLISPRDNVRYLYADTANTPAHSMSVLRTWMNTNFENK